MFNGLVSATGKVQALARSGGALRVTIATPRSFGVLRRGDSVAVDGVCLTAAATGPRRFAADVIPETLARTTLGGLGTGDRVNLEAALKVGSAVGGHWVLGHVDAVVEVRQVRAVAADYRLRLSLPAAIRRYVAFKGSIALHGVSLTVSAVGADTFEVALIPETLRRTTLAAARRGTRLNVEVDVLARYLEAQLADARKAGPKRRRAPAGGRRT
jgi:riboflavin synthase